MPQTPFALIAVSFAIGILLATEAGCGTLTGVGAIAGSLLFILFASRMMRRYTARIPRWRRRLVIPMAGISLGAGILVGDWNRPSEFDFDNDILPPVAVGEVMDVRSTTNGERLIVDVDQFYGEGYENLSVRNLKVQLLCKEFTASPGDVVSFIHALRPLEPNDNFRSSEKWHNLRRHRGIIYGQTLRFESEIKKTGEKLSFTAFSVRLRDFVAKKIECSGLQTPTKRFLVTVLLGDRTALTPDERMEFADAGIAHMLSLSGMHVAIVVGIFLFLCAPLSLGPSFRARFFVAMTLLWGYVFITGAPASVVRAALMASFVFLAIILQRRNSSINSLFAAAFVIMLFDPSSLFDPGFQLSFLSAFVILSFAQKTEIRSLFRKNWQRNAVSVICVSIIATAGTWALVSYHFGKLPLLFLPFNALVLPLLPAYVCAAIVYSVLLMLSVDFLPLGRLLDMGCLGLHSLTSAVNTQQYVLEYESSLLLVFLWLVVIMWGVFAFNTKSRVLRYSSVLLGMAAICFGVYENIQANHDMLIVRNFGGDLQVMCYQGMKEETMKMPKGEESSTTLLDTSFAFLDHNNPAAVSTAQKVDYLVLGRGYRGDIQSLLKSYSPGEIIIGPEVYKTKTESWMQESEALGIPIKRVPVKIEPKWSN